MAAVGLPIMIALWKQRKGKVENEGQNDCLADSVQRL